MYRDTFLMEECFNNNSKDVARDLDFSSISLTKYWEGIITQCRCLILNLNDTTSK